MLVMTIELARKLISIGAAVLGAALLPGGKMSEAQFLEVCRRSPNVFAEFMLGIEQGKVHKQFQKFLGQHQDCYAELHRGIGKTTQLACRVAWEIGHNRDLRTKYIQQNDTEAAKTTRAIRDLVGSDEYRRVFPHIEPDRECWGKAAFMVKRQKWSRDATVEGKSIYGRASGRFDLAVPDDICDLQNAIQRPAEREKVKEAWTTNWLPMADQSRDRPPRIWKVGTPYHVSDITAEWRAYHKPRGSLMRRPVVGLISPWPEAFTPEVLELWREKMGPIAYGRAFELTPISNELLVWPADWLQRSMYTEIPRDDMLNSQSVVTIDWAFTEQKQKGDPDYSVALFGRKCRSGHAYATDVLRVRLTFPDFVARLLPLCEQYGVEVAKAEANGPQRALVQLLNRQAPFPVTGLERGKDKHTRAAEKQPFVESGRFHIRANKVDGVLRPASPALQLLYDEMTTFPAGDHDDTVDAAVDLMEFTVKSGSAFKAVRFEDGRKPLSRIYG